MIHTGKRVFFIYINPLHSSNIGSQDGGQVLKSLERIFIAFLLTLSFIVLTSISSIKGNLRH
jgi:hypothetical protein